MPRSSGSMKVGISGAACLLFAFSLLILPLRWIMAALTAAIVHEACHALAVILCGGKLQSVIVGREGAVMTASPMTQGRELICTLAGPIGSGLMILAMPWLPRVAFCSAVHCVYNLLPIYPLDGGRAVRCATDKLSPKMQEGVCLWTENICLAGIFLAAIYLAFWKDLGWTPLILAGAVAIRAKSANSPCKAADLRLQ